MTAVDPTALEALLATDSPARRQVLAVLATLADAAAQPATTGPTDEELIAALRRDRERRGLSKGYIADAEYCIRGFLAWHGPGPVEAHHVEAWVDTLAIGLGARRNYISHLHQYFAFVAERTGRPCPTERIRRPKQPRLMPRPIHDEHLRRALAAAPSAELRCWLLLGAYGGLRCQEIAGLDIDDVRFTHGTLLVRHGKGAKERVVPLHPGIAAALRTLALPEAGPLFTMPDGRRVPPYVVSQRINKHLRRLGIPSTAHKLRHWFATSVYRASQDIRLTQELLGHASPSVTAVYAAADPTRAAPAVAALTLGPAATSDPA